MSTQHLDPSWPDERLALEQYPAAVALDAYSFAALPRFASSVIHEVNGPLGAALAKTQLAARLADEHTSPRLQDCLASAATNIRRAAASVRDLHLLFRDSHAVSTFDLQAVARAVRAVAAPEARRAGARIRLRTGDQPIEVTGDSLAMLLAVLQLTWQALDAGTRRLTLTTSASPGVGRLQITALPGAEPGPCWPASTRARLRALTGLHGGMFESRVRRTGRAALRITLPTAHDLVTEAREPISNPSRS